MKHSKSFLLVFSILLLGTLMSNCNGTSESSDETDVSVESQREPTLAEGLYKKYPLKFCTITYELHGASEGTETVYFEDWGTQEAIYSSMFMEEDTSNQLLVSTIDWGYYIDLDYKTGQQLVNGSFGLLAKNETIEEVLTRGESSLLARQNELVGTEVIAGKTCQVWINQESGNKLWIWQTIPLKSIIQIDEESSITKTAIIVDDSTTINLERFAVPKDIKFDEE